MRLRQARLSVVVAIFSLVGAFAAGAVAFNTADRFASTSTMNVRPVVPPATSETDWLEGVVSRLARDAFSRDFLVAVIEKHDLYAGARSTSSAEDLANRLRDDIRVSLISRSIVRVRFASSDVHQARAVADDLINQLVAANLNENLGSIVQVLDPPDESRLSVGPQHVAVAGLGGLGGGALLGTLIGWLPRRRSHPAC